MILEHRNDLTAFRQAVRGWVRDTLPPERAEAMARAKDKEHVANQRWWMAERNKVGLATPHWPSEFGGADLGLEHQLIVAEEFAQANTPPSDLFMISLNHIPATLIPFGTPEQKQRHLPAIAQGVVWCQGFSEPGSGSDLASLRTRAVRDGDHYVVNGQKIWSSYSMHADWCILLVRTDFETARKQQGISYFLLDMKSPGVEVRPIKKSTGKAMFAELFLTDVRIQATNLVGEENQGWTVAQATLSSERGVLVFEATERQRVKLERFYAQALARDDAWLGDSQLRREFISLFGQTQALRRQIRDLLAEETNGRWSMTPVVVKLLSSELVQRIGDLRTRIEGLDGQIADPDDEASGMFNWLESYGNTIAGGSNEIMRNLIAERGLGLPRG